VVNMFDREQRVVKVDAARSPETVYDDVVKQFASKGLEFMKK
jgi:hypothetical protein